MGEGALATALSNVGTIVNQAVGIVTGNEILMVLFAGGVLAVGFRAIKWAKRSVR